MVYESGYKSQNAFAAVSRKETGYVVDPAGSKGSSALGPKQQQYDSSKYSSNVKNDSQKYGAWGPVFKNKDNFVNMHLC